MSFDLVTHKRNKDGKVTHENHYTLKISEGSAVYERPPGSGMFYSPDGKLLPQSKKVEEAKIDAVVEQLVSTGPKEAPKAELSKEAPTPKK